MTTYSYSLTVNDSQFLALEASLKVMIEHCDLRISEGAGAPFWAHKKSCGEILEKLRSAETTLTSTNNFS